MERWLFSPFSILAFIYLLHFNARSKGTKGISTADDPDQNAISKSEIRSPKLETRLKLSKGDNDQNRESFLISLFGHWVLFRTSGFGFRVSTLLHPRYGSIDQVSSSFQKAPAVGTGEILTPKAFGDALDGSGRPFVFIRG
jgi:hypothetical protein